MTKNKLLIKVLCVLSALTLLTGCKPNTPSDSVDEGFKPVLDTEAQVVIKVAGFLSNFEAYDKMVAQFNEYYPNVIVRYDTTSVGAVRGYIENNEVDVFMTSAGNFLEDNPKQNVLEYCVNLSGKNIRFTDIKDEMIACGMVNGAMVMIPIAQNLKGMVVNKTLLQKEGVKVPETYAEFTDACNKLLKKGYSPIQGPINTVYGTIVSDMASVIIGTDKALTEKLNNGEVGAAESMRPVYNKLQALIDAGFIDKEVSSTYPSDNYDKAILKFFEGNVPFWVCNTEKVSGMKKRESKSEAFKANKFEYEFISIPMGDNGAYACRDAWYGFSVNKNSKNMDYAIEFMRYLATSEALNTIASVKGLPAVTKNSPDEQYSAVLNASNIEKLYANNGDIHPIVIGNITDIANKLGTGVIADVDAAIAELDRVLYEYTHPAE